MIKTGKDLLHIPVIMFSAYHRNKKSIVCFPGPMPSWQKPFDMKILLETIQSLLKPKNTNELPLTL